jgi:hypothetical protein
MPSSRASWQICRRLRAVSLDKEEPRTAVRQLQRIHLLRTRLNKGYMSQRRECGGCLRPSIALCYSLRGKEGRGREASPTVGHLLGQMEPVAQPATARCVRR